MRTNDADGFSIVCASCRDGVIRDPDVVCEAIESGRVPMWFIDTCSDIITGKIALVDYPVIEKGKTLFD